MVCEDSVKQQSQLADNEPQVTDEPAPDLDINRPQCTLTDVSDRTRNLSLSKPADVLRSLSKRTDVLSQQSLHDSTENTSQLLRQMSGAFGDASSSSSDNKGRSSGASHGSQQPGSCSFNNSNKTNSISFSLNTTSETSRVGGSRRTPDMSHRSSGRSTPRSANSVSVAHFLHSPP